MLTDSVEDVPITPRKRLMNFKIPHVARTSHQRRETVVVARRRLYDDEERERHSSEGEAWSGLSVM